MQSVFPKFLYTTDCIGFLTKTGPSPSVPCRKTIISTSVWFPPLLRQDVLQQESKPGDYIHGYMLNAGFSENILNWHKKHPDTPLRFFWDHWEEEPVKKIDSTLLSTSWTM